ncbi:MAG: hypothetical protein V5A64_01510 [Candidatus Thermoplasmatota archaeon]
MVPNIPSDEQIQKVLQKVLKENHTVSSQNKLKKMVDKEITKKKDEKTGVSPSRLRQIAINSYFTDLEIHSREGDPKKIMNKCPVCGEGLNRVKNLTIWGGKVTIEFRCPRCGYWTGKKKRIPTRYVFHYNKKR